MSSKNGDFIEKQKQSVRVRLPKRTKKAREREREQLSLLSSSSSSFERASAKDTREKRCVRLWGRQRPLFEWVVKKTFISVRPLSPLLD